MNRADDLHTHACPAGCGARVPQSQFACRTDWYRLPKLYRDAIWAAYRAKAKGEHLEAMMAAQAWYDEHPRPVSDQAPATDTPTRALVRPIRAEPDTSPAGDTATPIIVTPEGAKVGKWCESCDADVFWVHIQPSGKPMLVDAAPQPGGNLQVIDTDGGLRARVVRANEPTITGHRYGSHFATCPGADRHRKRR